MQGQVFSAGLMMQIMPEVMPEADPPRAGLKGYPYVKSPMKLLLKLLLENNKFKDVEKTIAGVEALLSGKEIKIGGLWGSSAALVLAGLALNQFGSGSGPHPPWLWGG